MIDKNEVRKVVEQTIADSSLFVVDVTVSADDRVVVTVDSPEGVDIDQCVSITRAIEAAFDRDVEDYELEVGSAGVTAPFTVPEQYRMNVGNDVEVLTRDGRKLHAVLAAVNDDCSQVTIQVPTRVKEEGAKRPVTKMVDTVLNLSDIKKIVREI